MRTERYTERMEADSADGNLRLVLRPIGKLSSSSLAQMLVVHKGGIAEDSVSFVVFKQGVRL